MPTVTRAALLVLLAGLLTPALAEPQNEQRFGDIVVHYNALSSTLLGAEVARDYGIARSSRRGLLIIAVQKGAAPAATIALKATVNGDAVNLTGQRTPITFREISGDEVSYIGTFDVDGPDTYTFMLAITPAEATAPLTLRFNQNFAGE